MKKTIVLFFFIVLCCRLRGCVETSENESLIYVGQIHVNHFDIAESINDSDEYYYEQNGTLYRYFLETGIQEIVEEEGVRIMYEEGAFVFYLKSANDDDILEEFWRYDKETEEKELLTIGERLHYGFCQEYVWYEDELHTGYICPVNGNLQNDKIAVDSLFSKENHTGNEQVIRAYGMEICRYYSQTEQRYVLSYIKEAHTPDMPFYEYDMETFIHVDEKLLKIWRCNTDDGDTRFYFGYEEEEPWEIPCLRDSKYSCLSVKGTYVIEDGAVIGLLKREMPKGHPAPIPYIKPEYDRYREALISLNPATGESEILYETEQYGVALSFGTEELEEEPIGYREGRLYVIKNNKIYCISVSSKEEKEVADMPTGEIFELTWRAGYLIIQEDTYSSHSQNDCHQILGVYKLEYALAESMQEGEVKKGEAEEEIDESEKLFHQFLNNEIAAYRESGELLFYRDLCEELYEFYEEEEIETNLKPTFYDLDNDGVDELIMYMDGFWGWYGGKYFDARDGKVYLFAEGGGTAEMLNYTDYKSNTWIYHYDISHGGREMFWFERYQGADCMVESFSLYDEFWEGEEHTYSLNEEEISMEEYITLYEEIFQHGYFPRNY